MGIKDDKARVTAIIDKAEKERLQRLAKEDNRSLSGYISMVISRYLKSLDKEG